MNIPPLSEGTAVLAFVARHDKIALTIELMIDFGKFRNKEFNDELGT